MSKKITLPKFTRLPNATAHSFPVQIAMQARKLLQGAVFYSVFVDTTVGEYFRDGSVAAYEKVRSVFMANGMSHDAWETSWACFEEYLSIFPNPVHQNTVFAMKSHWDWYIARLGNFVDFARHYVQGPILNKQIMKRLTRIGFDSIQDQLGTLEDATGLKLNVHPSASKSLEEMTLVRNLGMHHLWEVDEFYLFHTDQKAWSVGDIRVVGSSELERWHDALATVVHESAFAVAKHYAAAPEYDPDKRLNSIWRNK